MKKLALVVTVMALAISSVSAVSEASEENNISQKLALALVSGRTVTAKSQGLINDATKSDKGLTAEIFIKKMAADYKERSGIDLLTIEGDTELNRLLLAYVDATRETLNEAQVKINEKGKGFKGFIPAVFGRKSGSKFFKNTGVRLKQTSEKYRNRANKPDKYEAEILAQFDTDGYTKGEGIGTLATAKNGEEVYRFMQPIYIREACMKCHGSPAGELDIAGRKKEGYSLGDVRGAISVMLPMALFR